MKYCPKCGKQIPDHVKFCGHCGAAIHAAPSAPYTRLKITTPEKSQPAPKKEEKKLTMAAQATRNVKPTMASVAVKEAQKREEFHTASLKEKREMVDTYLNELLDGRLPQVKAKLKRCAQAASPKKLFPAKHRSAPAAA